MDNSFIIAGIISVTFFICKFIEMRMVDKESKPLKFLIRDSLMVYLCVLIGFFIFDQVKPMMNQVGGDLPNIPAAFTDGPGF
jgi:maltodextrin utilization protein YvdJ